MSFTSLTLLSFFLNKDVYMTFNFAFYVVKSGPQKWFLSFTFAEIYNALVMCCLVEVADFVNLFVSINVTANVSRRK